MRGVNVAAVLVAIGALACGSSSSSPSETTYYPGGEPPAVAQKSDASTMLPPPTPTCQGDDSTDACAAGVPGPQEASAADALDAAGEDGDVDGGSDAATDAPTDLGAVALDAGDSSASDGPDAASPGD